MSSLLNKLTGRKDTTSTEHHHHDKDMHNSSTHTSSTGTPSNNMAHTNMTAAPIGYNNLQQGSTTTTTTQQTTTTGTNPYGASGVMNSSSDYSATGRTGAAYGNSGMANTASSNYTTGSTVRDDAITRSEEQLRVGKERLATGKAELNKYVTTEHVEQPVAVTRERAVIEREPITSSNMDKALSGPPISEAHYETTLKSDVVQAEKEVVPIERIRLAKQTETTVQNIGTDLHKEHVDFTHTKMAGDNLNNTNLGGNNLSYNTTTPNKEY